MASEEKRWPIRERMAKVERNPDKSRLMLAYPTKTLLLDRMQDTFEAYFRQNNNLFSFSRRLCAVTVRWREISLIRTKNTTMNYQNWG